MTTETDQNLRIKSNESTNFTAKNKIDTKQRDGCCQDTSIGVYLLVSLFGMSSWIAINGVFMEQPLLVASLPEGWSLPSYLAVAVQIGNISIFVTTVLHQKYSERRHQTIVIYVMIVTSIIAVFCVAFLWELTTVIAGSLHSVPLIFLVFVLSLTSCSSSVVFLPFMANFKIQYIHAFFIGEGMSGLIPSVMALAQGIEVTSCNNTTIANSSGEFNTSGLILEIKSEPNFSVTTHTVIIAMLMVVSLIAFSLLNFSKFSKSAQVVEEFEEKVKLTNQKRTSSVELIDKETSLDTNGIMGTETRNDDTHITVKPHDNKEIEESRPFVQKMSIHTYGYYLLLTAWINALEHGILLSLQTYSTLPYGQQTYHLAVVLSNMVDPAACFLAEFIPVKSSSVISILTFIGSLISAYIVFLASLSPYQIPVGSSVGSFLSVASWITVISVLTFTKVRIVAIIRQEGKSALMWCGVTKQLGASLGAGLIYILINVFFLFQSSQTCG